MTDWPGVRPGLAPVGSGEPRTARLPGLEELLGGVDWVLGLSALALALLGSVLVWAATRQVDITNGISSTYYFERDLLDIAIGGALLAGVALVDYRAWRPLVPVIYGLGVLGLLAVLAVGSTVNGAHSRIVLPGGFQVQPSEFVKLVVVICLAAYWGEKRDGDPPPTDREVFWGLTGVAVLLGLIILQPDLGTSMVVVVTTFAMVALSGARLRWLVALLLGAAAVVFVGVHLHLLKSYQIARLTTFLDPHQHLKTTGYNTNQARLAIGSGGMFGTGLFHGPQTNGGFVPAQQTDFIFTVAGEELGFVGSAAIIGLYGLMLWRGLRIASAAPDKFGTLVASGIVAWFAFQAFINIGMTMGIMPVTGIPLPFLSYGGSALFTAMMAVGVLESVHIRSRRRQ